ncbi:sensor histidine kinase [Streptomyces luteolus]|uniref:histidine kinase n=1 Tax=Streptomyces luteolus TaxID=3043615 RepID=A0ABT6SQZ0_9ACTN|nr:histidine kinase [Streptomyces sp. B-S-A12]MDI3417264.1 histidine kinase [Streptomyces sp. B-S-A12]
MRRERPRDLLVDLVLWASVSAPVLLAGPPLGGLGGALAVAVLGGAVLLSRARPLVALALVLALVLWLTPEQFLVPCSPALVAFGWLAGLRLDRARPAVHLLLATGALGLPLTLLRERPLLWGWLTLLLTLATLVFVPWLAGRCVRQYGQLVRSGWELAARLEREQQVIADRERLRERSRIAADMHDSLGHELALIAVRAAALEVDPALPERQQAAARELRESTAAATSRLRDVIGVLRTDAAPPFSPTDETVAQLVERARESGLAVTLNDQPGGPSLSPMTDRAVHRVVQECLTNAAKHAPGAEVTVQVERVGPLVQVRSVNSSSAAASSVARTGSGLVGLDERVRLAGGTLTYGAAEGRFSVTAELPAAGGPACAVDPSAAALALAQARARVRRRVRQALLAPVVVLGALAILASGLWLLTETRSVLDRSTYDTLHIGDSRSDVDRHLPAFTMDGGPDGPERVPAGQECVYYRAEAFTDTAYRLCFADGRLVSKSVRR